MQDAKMDINTMEFMVWVIEIVSAQFFDGDKTSAYTALVNCGIWDKYIKTYDTTHALGKEFILEEIGGHIRAGGVL